MKPAYVMHDEHRWHVDHEIDIDGEPAYALSRFKLVRYDLPRRLVHVDARVSDCEPVVRKPQVRRIKEDDYVLEVGRTMSIRKKRSSKRYPVSLAGIYSSAVKAHVAAERFAKAKAKGKFIRRK